MARPLVYMRLLVWMKKYLEEAKEDNLTDLINMYGIGEVNTTLLTEAAVYESGIIPEKDQEAAIDDETHPVSDAAIDAAEWFENKYRVS